MLETMARTSDVFVVDDDDAIRDAICSALSMEGHKVESFTDAPTMLDALRLHTPAAIILDVMLPGQSGIETLKQLRAEKCAAPVMIITGHGNISMAVEAVKLGAYDFIEKPFVLNDLLDQVNAAINAGQRHEKATESTSIDLSKICGGVLTLREQEVLQEIAAGASSKEAGRILGISPRTIEVHRARIMDKLGARNAADLMRIIFSQHG